MSENYILDANGVNTVRILPGSWRNFRGAKSQFNNNGDMFFNVAIEDMDLVGGLKKRGFNVKEYRKHDDPDTEPTYILKIKVRFNDYGPKVTHYIQGNPNGTELDEDTIGILDETNIIDCVIKIAPYDWTSPNGKGTVAYLRELSVQSEPNRFGERFRDTSIEIDLSRETY